MIEEDAAEYMSAFIWKVGDTFYRPIRVTDAGILMDSYLEEYQYFHKFFSWYSLSCAELWREEDVP